MERRYLLICTLAGLVLGWLPILVHGPIPEKFDALYIRGSTAVWSYYVARCSIGFLIGITWWPAPWYLRGPLCGWLVVGPLTLISVAMPGCGPPCMATNLTSAATLGLMIAAIGERFGRV
ncbi:MAG TPA: hypothetical protein VEB21_09175 [Terriglobales bacterium]|nr:hypothetical protein [Terriglobales bacterium]